MEAIVSRVRYGLAFCATLYIVMFLAVVVLRIAYPYELEWMEGGTVDHVRQILSGAQVYGPPSLKFVPYVYPPFYYYVSALFCLVFGVGFFPLRLVSFLSSLGCMIIIYRFVQKETNSVVDGIISTGLYIATYRLCGTWFDLARVDSLSMLLILASLYLLRFRPRTATMVYAGALMSLAFLTKQSSLIIALFVALYCIVIFRGWHRWIYILVFVVTAGLLTSVMIWVSHGWYFYYVFELPAQHSLAPDMIWKYIYSDLVVSVTVACGFTIWLICSAIARGQRNDIVYYTCFWGGLFMTSFLTRIHRGGYDNVLMPVYAAVAIGFGIGLNKFIKRYLVENNDLHERDPFIGRWIKFRVYGVLAFCVVQFIMLWYNPAGQIPTGEDKKAGDLLIDVMKKIPGEVYLPYHGYLPILAGKSTYAHAMAIGDIVGSQSDSLREDILRQVRDAIRTRTFRAIILDQPTFTEDIMKNYAYRGPIFHDQNVFYPVTGSKMRPEAIFLLK
jgi:4-amino-4-deoxy-L-arabinose transferase-like glycosyltransferase